MVDFKNIKGHDNEGQLKNNQKREQSYRNELQETASKLKDSNDDYPNEEYDWPLSRLEQMLVQLHALSNLLEDKIENFIVDNEGKGIEDEISPTLLMATDMRRLLHLAIETKLRYHFSTRQLIYLANKNRDAS